MKQKGPVRKGVTEKAKAAPREIARRGLDDGTERFCGQLRNDRGQERPQDYGSEKIEGGAQRGAALAGRSVEAFLKSRKKEQGRKAERFVEKDIGAESVGYAAQESAEKPVPLQENANAQQIHAADIHANPAHDAPAETPVPPAPEKTVAMNAPTDSVQAIGKSDDIQPVHENRRYFDAQGMFAEMPTIKEKVSDHTQIGHPKEKDMTAPAEQGRQKLIRDKAGDIEKVRNPDVRSIPDGIKEPAEMGFQPIRYENEAPRIKEYESLQTTEHPFRPPKAEAISEHPASAHPAIHEKPAMVGDRSQGIQPENSHAIPHSDRIEENPERSIKVKERPVDSMVSDIDHPRISSEQRRKLMREKAELPGQKLPLTKDNLTESSSGGFSPKVKERPQEIHGDNPIETVNSPAAPNDAPVTNERPSKAPATREIPRGLETQRHETRQSPTLPKTVAEAKIKEKVGSVAGTDNAPSQPAISRRQIPIRVREQTIRERGKDAQISQRPTDLRQEHVNSIEGSIKEVSRPTIQPRTLSSSEDTQLIGRYGAKVPDPTG